MLAQEYWPSIAWEYRGERRKLKEKLIVRTAFVPWMLAFSCQPPQLLFLVSSCPHCSRHSRLGKPLLGKVTGTMCLDHALR